MGARANTWWSGTSRWGGAGQSRMNLSQTRHHPQTGEGEPQSCLRPSLLMVNGSPA